MINEKIKAKGSVTLVLRDKDGNIKSQVVNNMIMNSGLAYFTSRLKDNGVSAPDIIKVGTDGTATIQTQTDLQATLASTALDSATRTTVTTTYDSIEYVGTFAAGEATGDLREAGLYADTVMLSRTTFGILTKAATDIVSISWKLTFA